MAPFRVASARASGQAAAIFRGRLPRHLAKGGSRRDAGSARRCVELTRRSPAIAPLGPRPSWHRGSSLFRPSSRADDFGGSRNEMPRCHS